MTIGQKIRLLREEQRMTTKQLGMALGYSKSTAVNQVLGLERGYRLPKKQLLREIAGVLEQNPTVLVGGTPVENVLQHLFWLTSEEREEVIAVMGELVSKEEQVALGNLTEDELILWKIKWTCPEK
ncbi:MAG: helix-turn-helix transcriptional regulator [Eubacteriales bacterium]